MMLPHVRLQQHLLPSHQPTLLFCHFAKVLLLLALFFLLQGNVATAQASAPCDLIATDEASLNEAIGCVNSAGPGRHTIQIMADITLSQPTEQIVNPQASQIVFEGNDHVIDAQGSGRLFSIYLTEVAIHHLTLRGGLSVGADRLAAGGAILLLGSYGDGTCGLTVRDSVLTDNQSSAGGAIANLCDSSTITITNSILSYNRATRGGAIFIPTGEELVSALIIDQSRLTDNQAQEQGGAILLRAGDAGTDATISNSTIANNRVISGTGGGISVVTTSEPAITEVLLRNVALVNNMAAGGGGLEVYSRGATIVTVANTTISHNHADSLSGGGILVQGALEFDTTDVRLINSTVASNTAPSAGGIAKLDGLITLTNTLVAGNSNGDCQWDASPGLPNRVVSGGNNLDSDGSCLPVGVRQPSDIPTGNANLGPLDDNGGPTVSHVLLTGSQAIDAGNDAVCAVAPVNGVDQRGVLRPQGAHCDMGAYERPDAVACGYPVLTANDEATLRQAIDCLNVAPSGAYTLNITADIAYSQPMFRLHNGALTAVVVAGNGHTLDAQGHGRVLTLEDVQALTLRDLTLTGGNLSGDGSAANGGGVAFDCTRDLLCNWTLINTTIQDNQANAGGGIDYDCSPGGGGGLVVQDSVIRGNRARAVGGGLFYSTDEDSLACSVTIQNSTIENNQAEEGGGLRIARPRVTISDSTIRNNYASQTGGGMMARISDGFIDMTVLRSTINNNRAGVSGGGVYVSSPDQRFDIRFINSTISGNTVDSGNGGGFYLQETEGSLLISLINSTVTQNQATGGAGVHIFDRAAAPSYYTSTLRLSNSLIADNQGSDCTGEVAPGVVFTGQRILSFGHNLDSDGSCLTAEVRQPGDIPNGNANLGPLANNGGPTLTHQPLAGSQAIDAGDDAVCAAAPVNGVDQRGAPRPQDAHCEIGAVEVGAQAGSNVLFASSRSSGRAGNVTFRDEDIVAYDFTNNTWQMIFDGSDTGVTKDVDAFVFRADGSLLLSFNGPTVVPGVGPVDDSDIVKFTPTRLGSDTAGSFTLYLRGADVGLTTDGEDIDAIGFTAAGNLVVSTIGDFDAPNAQGRDEDLFVWTNGQWQRFFVGANVGLANEDVNGLWIDPATGERYLTVKDDFAFDNVQIDSDDIFVCTPTQAGGCTFRRFWDSDVYDYGSENLDHIGLGSLPTTLVVDGQSRNLEALTAEEIAADEERDDLDLAEARNNAYLPWIVGR